MADQPPLCTDCKHHKEIPDQPEPGHMCVKRLPDVVGIKVPGYEYWLGPLCTKARYEGPCGIEGRYFEAVKNG